MARAPRGRYTTRTRDNPYRLRNREVPIERDGVRPPRRYPPASLMGLPSELLSQILVHVHGPSHVPIPHASGAASTGTTTLGLLLVNRRIYREFGYFTFTNAWHHLDHHYWRPSPYAPRAVIDQRQARLIQSLAPSWMDGVRRLHVVNLGRALRGIHGHPIDALHHWITLRSPFAQEGGETIRHAMFRNIYQTINDSMGRALAGQLRHVTFFFETAADWRMFEVHISPLLQPPGMIIQTIFQLRLPDQPTRRRELLFEGRIRVRYEPTADVIAQGWNAFDVYFTRQFRGPAYTETNPRWANQQPLLDAFENSYIQDGLFRRASRALVDAENAARTAAQNAAQNG